MSALHIPLATTSSKKTSTASNALAVSASNISLTIDNRAVLRDLSFEITQGQFVALLGANGAGKSTLLSLLATLTAPSHGELRLFGQRTRAGSAAHRARIGFIGHRPMLYRELSALENLLFFGRLYGVPNPRERAMELLEYVGLRQRASDPICTFSRGMTQRVAIARAIIHRPELLLADEPFAGLDAPSTRSIESILMQLHKAGMTVILANHDIAQSLTLSDRVIALVRGRLVLNNAVDASTTAATLLEVIGS